MGAPVDAHILQVIQPDMHSPQDDPQLHCSGGAEGRAPRLMRAQHGLFVAEPGVHSPQEDAQLHCTGGAGRWAHQ